MQEKGTVNQIIEQDKIKYSINDLDQTAKVIGCDQNLQQVKIPTSLEHESKKYYVISISKDCFERSNISRIEFSNESKLETIEERAFSSTSIESITIPNEVRIIGKYAFFSCEKLRQIEFSNESKLETIEGGAFCYTSIESITIPSKVIDLKEEWCIGTHKLSKVKVSPSNPRYCCLDEVMIIGKETIESNDYENLVFCARNIKSIKIPNFIKRIYSCSFCGTSIEKITIPSEIRIIGKSAFSNCNKLRQIEFSNESKLETIEKLAFAGTLIESITIPSEVINLKDGWCIGAFHLSRVKVNPSNPRYRCLDEVMIIGKETIESSDYENLVFCAQNIKSITIPDFIKRIYSYSFLGTSIEKITIPKEVKIIQKNAFYLSIQLRRIEFSNESKLETIGEGAFHETSIDSITIPNEVRKIEMNAFSNCKQLQIINICEKSKLDSIDKSWIDLHSKSILMIPSNLRDRIKL